MPAAPLTDDRTSSPPSAWVPVLVASAGLVTLLTLLVAAFTWPPSQMEPRDLPVAVAASAPVAAQVEQRLAASGAGLEVTSVADRAAAVELIESRDAYAAVVVTPEGPELLTASAAGPMVAQLLTQGIGSALPDATVTDVVPGAEGDPRGAVFGAGALPLALGGIVIGAVTSLALRRTGERLAVALVVGVVGGFALTGVLQGWLDALGGSYVVNAGVVALGILAVALPIVGLRHLIGPAAVAVVALLVMLVGNPLSGVTSAPELLPLGWLGQFFPPGAVGSALRGTAFFDGAGTTLPLTVLAVWAVVGLLLALVPRRERGPGALEA